MKKWFFAIPLKNHTQCFRQLYAKMTGRLPFCRLFFLSLVLMPILAATVPSWADLAAPYGLSPQKWGNPGDFRCTPFLGHRSGEVRQLYCLEIYQDGIVDLQQPIFADKADGLNYSLKTVNASVKLAGNTTYQWRVGACGKDFCDGDDCEWSDNNFFYDPSGM